VLTGLATTERSRATQLAARTQAPKQFEQLLHDHPDQPAIIEASRSALSRTELPIPPQGVYIADYDQNKGKIRGPVERISDWDESENFGTLSPDGQSLAKRRTSGVEAG